MLIAIACSSTMTMHEAAAVVGFHDIGAGIDAQAAGGMPGDW